MAHQVRRNIPGFDLTLTTGSGQCFRFNETQKDCYSLIAYGKWLQIRNLGNDCFQFDCDAADFEKIWRLYFDVDCDYGVFGNCIPAEDGFLRAAFDYAWGLRILRQSPWETLISFIISQRKNIPAIKGCVETLSHRFGNQIDETSFAFPEPWQLSGLTLEELQACSLGYRSRYILQTARQVAEGRIDLGALSKADDASLQEALCALPGVGEKVAHCVMLFGFHRLSAFPRDVWINRVINQEYDGSFPLHLYAPYAGVIQQYMFCYGRSPTYRKMQENKESAI